MLTGLEEKLFTRSRSVVSRVVAGETLIVPVRGKVGDLASIYSFNGTGSLIWKLLDAPCSLAELIDAVENEYAIDRERAQNDVTQFLNDMLSVGLLDVRPKIDVTESEMTGIDMNAAEANQQETMETAATN
jgi:hypothetical protein